ncbi:Predicted dehydrogenase [Cognatiyoonia sediminum]|uniref:Predicted dehydrogenase n=1 Tax=Cognatiyoonia sediminum TaxID=1508389 RepID=A0A1M5QYI1_9RHOB|nr:Gfo/Idh/MocA family oxidoreductase [Cognatiyoonia sediminum]SHH18938.1 Predicted dehydrogenase [Cognatiyoonia sediminum]
MARIRLGMVGGGNDAFIGAVHRIASRIDDRFELVAGALSSTPEKAIASGQALGLDPDRTYANFTDMAKREARLKNGIEAVAIVTPNHVHYPASREFLKRNIHVICDKPLTSTMADAKKLVAAVEKSDALFVLTHNYTGYPMMRQARQMVADGDLGKIRLVQVEYPQDWLTEAAEDDGVKQAEWRTDPARSGAGGCVGDIGTHAYNLAGFVTGLRLEELAADLHSFVPGRLLDDNVNVMLRYEGGARGMLWSSQVAPGNENGLKLRVYGEKGGIEWTQADPNYLWFTPFGEPKRLITRGGAGSNAASQKGTRIPPGHPEGYLEGFANIYSEAADAIEAARAGKSSDALYPTVEDGLDGMKFIQACVASSKRNSAWLKL